MLEYLLYISGPLKSFLRVFLIITAVYLLFLTTWSLVFIGKQMHWPAVEAKFDHRQIDYRYTPFHSPGSRGGGSGRGLYFVEEVFYIPSRNAWAIATDWGYLSRRKAIEKCREREKELPVGAFTGIRIKPGPSKEATTHLTFGPAFKASGAGYLLGALASLLGVWLLGFMD